MLGVAGGELIIPTLILVFGVDIKLAGTASLLISLPTILVGLYRHRQKGAFREPADLRKTVFPMGVDGDLSPSFSDGRPLGRRKLAAGSGPS